MAKGQAVYRCVRRMTSSLERAMTLRTARNNAGRPSALLPSQESVGGNAILLRQTMCRHLRRSRPRKTPQTYSSKYVSVFSNLPPCIRPHSFPSQRRITRTAPRFLMVNVLPGLRSGVVWFISLRRGCPPSAVRGGAALACRAVSGRQGLRHLCPK